MIMRADLHRAIAGIDHRQRLSRPAGGKLDLAVDGDDRAGLERIGAAPASGRIGSCTVTSLVPSGNTPSTCRIGSMAATPGITSSRGEDRRAERHQVGDAFAFARAFEDFVGDDGDRLGMVELEPLGAALARELGGGKDGEAFQLGRREQHRNPPQLANKRRCARACREARDVNPRHETFDLRIRRHWRRQVGNRRQEGGEHGLCLHCADAAEPHRGGNQSGRGRIAGDKDCIRLAHAARAPDEALHDRQMAVSVAGLDLRTKFRGALGAQAHMRSQQSVAVALRSVAQRLRQRRRLHRLIDLGKFVEVVARAMGQGDRDAVGRRPAMLQEHGDDIAQAAPVERSVHRGKSFDPVGKCETAARKGGIRVLQDREQIAQSKISSASASDEMTRRSRINAPIRAR